MQPTQGVPSRGTTRILSPLSSNHYLDWLADQDYTTSHQASMIQKYSNNQVMSPRASNAATSLAKQQHKEPFHRDSNTTMSSFLESVVPNKNLQLKS